MPSVLEERPRHLSKLSDPQTADRLAKVLQLLDSPHDGEALAAGRRAMAILRQSGLGPTDLAKRLSTPPQSGPAKLDRALALEAQLAAATSALTAVKAELKHWQDQAWTAASLVAELEDAVREANQQASLRPPGAPEGVTSAEALPRTQAEKREAVRALLDDPSTAVLSDRELARRLSLSPQTIGNWRRRLGKSPGPVHGRRGSIKSKQLP
jgi:hypothetical protein